MLSKHRLEALSDGIFAIAMTLLVLDLKVPGNVPAGELWHALQHEGITWLCFAVTFFISARFWVLQHRVFALLDEMEPETAVITMIFLGLVTLLPFSTSLWAQHINERLAFFLYCLHQSALAACLVVQYELARYRGHLHDTAANPELRQSLLRFFAAMGLGAVTAFVLPLRTVGFLPAAVALIGRKKEFWWTRMLRKAPLAGKSIEYPVAPSPQKKVPAKHGKLHRH